MELVWSATNWLYFASSILQVTKEGTLMCMGIVVQDGEHC